MDVKTIHTSLLNPHPKLETLFTVTPSQTHPECTRKSRPIPNINLRNISKANCIEHSETSSTIHIALDKFKKGNSGNLLLGTLTGWLAGVAVMKVGKIAAFGLGGGIILLHFASDFGYINVNWDKIKELSGQSQLLMEQALKFMRKNSCFSVGLAGGFFFGVASA